MMRRTGYLWLAMVAAAAGCVGEDDGTTDPAGSESSAQKTVAVDARDGGPPTSVDAAVVADAGGGLDAGRPADGGCATLTYETFGKAFMQQYCVGCHQGPRAPDGIDLTTVASIKANKREIDAHAVRTPRSKPMPPPTAPQPSAADRAKLGQWLTCGPN